MQCTRSMQKLQLSRASRRGGVGVFQGAPSCISAQGAQSPRGMRHTHTSFSLPHSHHLHSSSFLSSRLPKTATPTSTPHHLRPDIPSQPLSPFAFAFATSSRAFSTSLPRHCPPAPRRKMAESEQKELRKYLQQSHDKIFESNRKWAEEQKEKNPDFFKQLSAGQAPDYLWIGE